MGVEPVRACSLQNLPLAGGSKSARCMHSIYSLYSRWLGAGGTGLFLGAARRLDRYAGAHVDVDGDGDGDGGGGADGQRTVTRAGS